MEERVAKKDLWKIGSYNCYALFETFQRRLLHYCQLSKLSFSSTYFQADYYLPKKAAPLMFLCVSRLTILFIAESLHITKIKLVTLFYLMMFNMIEFWVL